MTSGLVNASLSLPKWQAIKIVFFAPCCGKLVTAFHLTTDDLGSLDDTIALTEAYYSYLNEKAVQVQQIKGSTSQTYRLDGTLSSTSLNSVIMILLGLKNLIEKVPQLNQEYLRYLNVHSLLTLFVENFFLSMRAGNTATPTMLDFSLRFPRCTKGTSEEGFRYLLFHKSLCSLLPAAINERHHHQVLRFDDAPKASQG